MRGPSWRTWWRPAASRPRGAHGRGPIALAALVSLGVALWAWGAVSAEPTRRIASADSPPQRIVSLIPGVTEILFAIGAQDRLVGVTDFCDYPPEARRKPRVGSMIAPSLEAIAALRPDLVIATPSGNSLETERGLERLGLRVLAVEPRGVADVVALVERLGAVTGRGETARAVAAALRSRVDDVARRVARLPRPRVLFVVWPEPLVVPGRGSLVADTIALAGGESVSDAAGEGYPRMSLEAALARRPEVVVLTRPGSQSMSTSREQWERLSRLFTTGPGRLHEIDADLYYRYGPRVVSGVEELARLLHPAAFASRSGP
jgi:iron complex transport system substrate-binding protein